MVLKTTELIYHVIQVMQRLQILQIRWKSYANICHFELEFQVRNVVLLSVSPWKGVICFRKKGKLGPRFIGPFQFLSQVGKVAYRLDLLEEISQIHSTFHVSQLRKCVVDVTSMVPLDEIQVYECLNYVERPIAILERKSKTLLNKVIQLQKVQCQHRKG